MASLHPVQENPQLESTILLFKETTRLSAHFACSLRKKQPREQGTVKDLRGRPSVPRKDRPKYSAKKAVEGTNGHSMPTVLSISGYFPYTSILEEFLLANQAFMTINAFTKLLHLGLDTSFFNQKNVSRQNFERTSCWSGFCGCR
jgi:hypothetical protein